MIDAVRRITYSAAVQNFSAFVRDHPRACHSIISRNRKIGAGLPEEVIYLLKHHIDRLLEKRDEN